MSNGAMLERARKLVFDWYRERGNNDLSFDNVYVVWFCKTLQNWKALVSTDEPDHRYFEITHNGVANETYLDSYIKEENRVFKV